jgi:FkbM family methyltransferase
MPHLTKTFAFRLAQALGSTLGRLQPQQVESLARQFAGSANARQLHGLATFANAFRQQAGLSSLPDQNGEFALIGRLAPLGLRTVFDVGANVGDWTRQVCAQHPAAHVHSFEIVPDTFAQLQSRLADLTDRVTLNPFGLSDADGMIEVYLSGDSLTSSINRIAHIPVTRTAQCAVRNGDDYVEQAGIAEIDFLKVDV